jgi:hypothetical protein
LGDDVAGEVFSNGATWESFSARGGRNHQKATEQYSIFKDGVDANDIQ